MEDNKKEIGYPEVLCEEIEKKLKKAEIYKTFMNYMTHHEEDLDSKVVPDSSQGEEQKRRKKSAFTSYVDKFTLEDEEIIKDLNGISKDPSTNVRILDGVLYVRSHRLVKGDRVIIKGKREEIVGSLSLVDEDEIVVKSKENKRIRIGVDEFRKHVFTINKYYKK